MINQRKRASNKSIHVLQHKKGQLALEQPAILILAILVILGVVLFFFRANFNSFFQNLPGFEASQKNEDIVISSVDEQIDKCAGEHLVAITKNNGERLHIYLPGNEGNFSYTSLYLKKDNIYLQDSLRDTFIGKVSGDLVVIDDSNFLDENYERYSANLFEQESGFFLTAKQLDLLNGAEFRGGIFCKGDLETSKDYVAVWPKESIFINSQISNGTVRTWKYFFILSTKNYRTIKFDSFITCSADSLCSKNGNFLFIKQEDGFQKVYFYDSSKMEAFGPIFVIANDGSIWLDLNMQVEDIENFTGLRFESGIAVKNTFYRDYYKTNLKIDYLKLPKN